jgi:hypothetical protein
MVSIVILVQILGTRPLVTIKDYGILVTAIDHGLLPPWRITTTPHGLDECTLDLEIISGSSRVFSS